MKKTVSLVLSILMILGMIVIPTAAQTDLEMMDEALIVHYDFEGTTKAQQYADKATGGQSAETINTYNASTTVDDGIVQIAGGSNMKSDFATTTVPTAGSDYMQNTTNEFTFYAKFRLYVDEAAVSKNPTHSIFRVSAGTVASTSMQIFANGWDTAAHTVKISVKTPTQTIAVGTISYSYDGHQDDTFYCVAWSMKYTTAWEHNVYLSSDAGKTYSVQAPATSNDAAAFFNTTPNSAVPTRFELNILNSTTLANNSTYLDDFRIYNKALDASQLELIQGVPGGENVYPKDRVIVHYDFEGADEKTQLADKAVGGSSKEVFEVKPGQSSMTVQSALADGILSVGNGTRFIELSLSSNAGESGSDYLNNTTGEFTFYIDFRLDGDDQTTGGFIDILNTSNASVRVYATSCNTTKQTVDIYVRNNISVNTNLKSGIKIATINYSNATKAYDNFYRLAWTMKYDSANTKWIHNAYLSDNNGNTYSQVLTNVEAADSATFFNAATWMGLGAYNSNRLNNTFHFDDFRIYNKALTVDELPKADLKFDITANPDTGAMLHGVQTSVNKESGKYSVRFVGSVDSLNYKNTGFHITAQSGAYAWNMSTTEVYQTLLANSESGIKEISAEAMRGANSYLYALSITDIPLVGTVSFVVTPYTAKGGVTTNGTSYVIIFEDGVCKISYKSVHDRTYGSVVDYQLSLEDKAVQDDVKLVNDLIARMGTGFAVKVGSSNVLYNGMIQKADTVDYTKITRLGGNGVLVPVDFAATYFGGVTDTDGYVDISALCDGTSYNWYYDTTTQIAVVTPAAESAFTSADAKYITRMNGFFTNTAYFPEPTKPVEQTRKEIVAQSFTAGKILDYTNFTYECYGSPEILVVDGTWYMTYDINQMSFPNGTNTAGAIDTVFMKSTDGGKTWTEIELIEDLMNVAMIEHDGKIILMGNRKSKSLVYFGWYDPTGEGTYQGQEVTGFDRWGSAATSMVIKDDRIYRAYNYAVISADLSGADWTTLWTKDNWVSTAIPKELITETIFTQVTGIDPNGWGVQEGNVVLVGDEIYAVYRIDASPAYGYAAVFTVSYNGTALTLTPAPGTLKNGTADSGIIENFPGNQSKFQIKYDTTSRKYISFVNVTTEGGTANQRNVVYMITSTDLLNWTKVGAPVLVDRAMMNNTHSELAHAFQYISFDFVGTDIVMVIRESFGDSCNYHNANAITMYTVAGYADYLN